jgi:hypothetical protein
LWALQLLTGLTGIVAEKVEDFASVDAPLLDLACEVVERLDLNANSSSRENASRGRTGELVRSGCIRVQNVKVAT